MAPLPDTKTPGEAWRLRLGLEAHPEGGWFRRIHTAGTSIETAHGPRPLASSIHYLLDRDRPAGRFHRVRSTILHFLQSGGPVEYALVDADGGVRTASLAFEAGAGVALEVAGGTWKASRLVGAATHALVSEVVLPGFAWADHEYLAPPALARWPAATTAALRRQGWRLD